MRNVLLIGAGVIADTHVQVLRGLQGVTVQGVVDLDRAKAARFAKRWRLLGLPKLAGGAKGLHATLDALGIL